MSRIVKLSPNKTFEVIAGLVIKNVFKLFMDGSGYNTDSLYPQNAILREGERYKVLFVENDNIMICDEKTRHKHVVVILKYRKHLRSDVIKVIKEMGK